jgi:hypothetical protein
MTVVLLQINWNLSSVNAAMAVTGVCQLSRKIRSVTAKPILSLLIYNSRCDF